MRVSERENVRVPESGSESERKCAKRMCVCVCALFIFRSSLFAVSSLQFTFTHSETIANVIKERGVILMK